MKAKSVPKGVIKDVIIVAIGVLIIWIGLQVVFGTTNPFYVVASGSMVPALQMHDVLIVQGHEPFSDIGVGDIIVFDRPSDHNRVIVHRVAAITDDDPRTLRTKGDANPGSIPGTDFPITDKEYIGKVIHTVPQIGYVTQILKPPINYILIALVIGIMIVKQMTKNKDGKDTPEPPKQAGSGGPAEAPPDLDIPKDTEYSAPPERPPAGEPVPEKPDKQG